MRRYEVLVLSVPEITQDEIKMLEDKFEQTVKKEKGTVMSFERWGKFRLAYPVKKNDYGVYFLARFEVKETSELLENIKTLLAVDFNNLVARHVISALDIEKPLAYQRPQSLEEAPKKEMGTFLRGRRPFSRPGSDRGSDRGPRQEYGPSENRNFSRQEAEDTSSQDNDDQFDNGAQA